MCVCEIVDLTPNHQQIQITVEQLKSEEFSQNLTPYVQFSEILSTNVINTKIRDQKVFNQGCNDRPQGEG